MHSMLWAAIEFSSGAAVEETNGPGALVLLLLIAAVACIGLAHFAAPALWRRRTTVSHSALFATGDVEGEAGATRTDKARRRGHLFLPKGAEKRRAVRRGGEPVPVWIAESADSASSSDGMVMDRSRGGLMLAVDKSAAVGSVKYVRAYHAPDDLEWVPLEVRHCRKQDERWILGCKFKKELPWNILLMFG
jgi:hypothetical protein